MLALTLTCWLAGAAPEPLTVQVGAARLIPLPAGVQAAAKDAGVVQLKRMGQDKLLIVGLREGTTTLELTGPGKAHRSEAVTVIPHDDLLALADMRRLLGDVSGVALKGGRCLQLTCVGCGPKENDRVAEVSALYPCTKSVDPIAPRKLAPMELLEAVTRALGEGPDDTPGLVLDASNGRLLLKGEARSEEDVRRVNDVRVKFPELEIRVLLPPLMAPAR